MAFDLLLVDLFKNYYIVSVFTQEDVCLCVCVHIPYVYTPYVCMCIFTYICHLGLYISEDDRKAK